MSRKYELHSGQRGSALGVRITPRASRNQIVGVLNDSTIKVHLVCGPSDEEINTELLCLSGGSAWRAEITRGNCCGRKWQG